MAKTRQSVKRDAALSTVKATVEATILHGPEPIERAAKARDKIEPEIVAVAAALSRENPEPIRKALRNRGRTLAVRYGTEKALSENRPSTLITRSGFANLVTALIDAESLSSKERDAARAAAFVAALDSLKIE